MEGKFEKSYVIILVTLLFIGTIVNGLVFITNSSLGDQFDTEDSCADFVSNLSDALETKASEKYPGSRAIEEGRAQQRNEHGVVGPLELLNNNNFDTITSWDLKNAYNGSLDINHTLTIHNQGMGYIQFISDQQVEPDETPFDKYPIRAKIIQTFNKTCWTSTIPNQQIIFFSFNYLLAEYIGIIDIDDVVFGEFYLKITNITPGFIPTSAEWPLVATKNSVNYNGGHFITGDTRLSIPQSIKVDVSAAPPQFPSFSLHPPGWYKLELIYQIYTESKTTIPNIITQYNVTIDDISLKVNDIEVPEIIANKGYDFGPYNDQTYDNETFGMIDIDFDAKYLYNTPLKDASYRLNNSGTPSGSWYRFFRVNQAHLYTQDWSISGIWDSIPQGKNTFDLNCRDQIGNFNDTKKFTVFKDTLMPSSNTSALDDYYTTKEIEIAYEATDPGLELGTSGGFNNTVVLAFKNATMPSYLNYTTLLNQDGLFYQSPIKFNLLDAGNYGEGVYSFYTLSIDNTSNHEEPPAIPDATTTIDFNKPVSKAYGLDSLIDVKTFNVPYNAFDYTSGVDYTELWYKLNDVWILWNNTIGVTNFTSSPIEFTAPVDGIYGFYTVAYDNAGNIEKGGVPGVSTTPDIIVQVDSQAPSPIFIKPIKDAKLKGKITLTVHSDFDTEYIEFYYWVDMDKDCLGDDENDKNSSWKYIDNQSLPSIGNNWSTTWNTKLSPELASREEMVIIKAIGADSTGKKGEGTVCVEVDNEAPKVVITYPEPKSAINKKLIHINYTTDDDVELINIYYKKVTSKTWDLIIKDYKHTYGEVTGSYGWTIPDKFYDESPEVDVKVETFDEVGNSGNATVRFGINWAYPFIKPGFPIDLNEPEDFGKFYKKLTEFEGHSNTKYSGDNLQWYVTGNTGTVFYLSGNNNTGEDADTFTYTSIANKYGEETLTFHLWDPQGLEAIIVQKVSISSVNDAPTFSPPLGQIQVTVGEADTLDMTPYIDDVDDPLSDLTITTDDTQYITTDGLKLVFNYPTNKKDTDVTVKVTVKDKEPLSTSGNLRLYLTDNHRPTQTKPLPTVTLKGGVRVVNVFDMNDYFSDPDAGDTLIFTAQSVNIKITINSNGTVDMQANEDINTIEKVRFRATDQKNAFVDGYMMVTIEDINNPPLIKPIPDLYVRYVNPNDLNYTGYKYDFSYFIFDPDDDNDELIVWGSPIETELNDYILTDPDNKLGLIFKFPFNLGAEGKKHPIYLNVRDPKGGSNRLIFNVTVIIDNWPVMQIGNIEDQSFEEDGKKDNAFKVKSYFWDEDDTTTYEVITKPNSKIIADIDKDGFVDLEANEENWFGEEELVVLAHDTLSESYEQFVYVPFKVIVTPVNDPPKISAIEPIIVTKGDEKIINLDEYISDIDTPVSSLIIESEDQNHVSVSSHLLYIKYNKEGKYDVQIKVIDIDKSSAETTLHIEVEKKAEREEVIPQWLILAIAAVIIIVIVMIVLLFVVMSRYKVHEVFLIHQSGILLHHLSREHIPGRDEEILSGMFTAVQEFIKDSFSTSGRHGKPGNDDYVLREMKIGDNNNILIERGKYIYLAVIFSGRGTSKLRTKVRNILEDIETRYELPFRTWVGDMDKLAGVERLLQPLIPEGGRPVMVSDKQLGRVPTPRPGGITPGRAPSPAPSPAPTFTPTTVPSQRTAPVTPKQVQVSVSPVTAVKPVSVAAVTPKPATHAPATATATATPAKITPVRAVTPAAAKPALAAAKPAMAVAAVKPATTVAAVAVEPKCPKCGAVAKKFPDGSLLCPKCGYTGN